MDFLSSTSFVPEENGAVICQLCSLQSPVDSVYNGRRSCCYTPFGWAQSSANVSMSYPKIIAAICEQLRQRYGAGDAATSLRCEDVAGQVLKCQAAMPDFLRLGMRFLTWFFDYWGLITSGSRFHRLPAELQRRQLDSWANSHIDVCRNFVRFYASLYFLIVMEEDAQ